MGAPLDHQASVRLSKKAVIRGTRLSDHQLCPRPLTIDQLEAQVKRDAVLIQGQSSGTIPHEDVPKSLGDVERSLSLPAFKEHPTRPRLVSNIKRLKRWQALDKAQKEGDLPKLQHFLKGAQVDHEFYHMPIVRTNLEALKNLAQVKKHCQEALEVKGDPEPKELAKMKKAVQIAEKIAEQQHLGSKLWDDEVLSQATLQLRLAGIDCPGT